MRISWTTASLFLQYVFNVVSVSIVVVIIGEEGGRRGNDCCDMWFAVACDDTYAAAPAPPPPFLNTTVPASHGRCLDVDIKLLVLLFVEVAEHIEESSVVLVRQSSPSPPPRLPLLG